MASTERTRSAAPATVEQPPCSSSNAGEESTSSVNSHEDCACNSLCRKVSFDRIEIREYARCLGDNPATTHGPSLSLDWDYNASGAFDLEQYESSRPARRGSEQMLVPGPVREDILKSHTGVTKRQIDSAVSENKLARHRRQMTVALLEYEDWALLAEAIKRRWRRMRSGISKAREQELLWEEAKKIRKQQSSDTEGSVDDSSTQDVNEERLSCSHGTYEAVPAADQ